MKETKNWTGFSTWVNVGFVLTVAYVGSLVFAWSISGPGHFLTRPDTLDFATFANVLTGVVAPLAFLWLFVATMVQSQELALQRHQIEANRQVAEEQAASTQRTAEFIGTQTELLRQQIATREEEKADEEFALRQNGLIEFCRKHFPSDFTIGRTAVHALGAGLSADGDLALVVLTGRIRALDSLLDEKLEGATTSTMALGLGAGNVHELDRRLVEMIAIAPRLSRNRMPLMEECDLTDTLVAVRKLTEHLLPDALRA